MFDHVSSTKAAIFYNPDGGKRNYDEWPYSVLVARLSELWKLRTEVPVSYPAGLVACFVESISCS
jgi:hypothetical protein